jgi:hypothetical protein
MKKSLAIAAVAALVSANAFATYIVVLRNGQTYKAKAKPAVQNGKALVTLENGQTLALEGSLIDFEKSDQTTAAGLGGATIIAVQQPAPAPAAPQQSTLGSAFHIKKNAGGNAAPVPAPAGSTPAPAAPAAVAAPSGTGVGSDVIDKFQRAYENVGLFEYKVAANGPGKIHVELTADSEDKVFNAISATSFLIVRDAGVPGTNIQMVELFMKTTMGGSAGRFQMTKADAQALDSKAMSLQEYFVRRVIY